MGEFALTFDSIPLPADPGLALVTYSADPGTPSAEAMGELARWTATRAALSAARSQSPS